MEVNQQLLYFVLQTINLNQYPKLTFEQLKNIVVNPYSDISKETFDEHFEYLKTHCYISYFNTMKDDAPFIYDLGLTFYGKTILKKHHSTECYDSNEL